MAGISFPQGASQDVLDLLAERYAAIVAASEPTEQENQWRRKLALLEEQGYQLRPRLQPGWKPMFDTPKVRWSFLNGEFDFVSFFCLVLIVNATSIFVAICRSDNRKLSLGSGRTSFKTPSRTLCTLDTQILSLCLFSSWKIPSTQETSLRIWFLSVAFIKIRTSSPY